jgi:hypothetical protein
MQFIAAWLFIVSGTQVDADFTPLENLNEELAIKPDGHFGGCLNISVNDINQVRVSRTVVDWALRRKDDVGFQRALIASLLRTDSDVGAYVLLNELYPEKRLMIATASFALNQEMRYLEFRANGFVSSVSVSRKTYQKIAADYWEVQLLSPENDVYRIGNFVVPVSEMDNTGDVDLEELRNRFFPQPSSSSKTGDLDR